ncbi:MAG: Metal-dependent hydrolase, endonuclease/exonuclease/phosphatase family [Myxococcales bacterium]|nr:Metal-dependent hydrolase, endonuclease/exonuclease/phosphatase family [Myxococcales bacterium]
MRRLRVVTWNVGRLYSPRHNNRLDDADVPAVVRALGELDPDVVLLQELVDVRQLEAVRGRLRYERGAFAGALAERCAYDRRAAVLVREELAPTFEEQSLGATNRNAMMARFDAGGVRVAAISAHFDVFDRERRAEQASSLAALAEARGERLVVAGGDFNLDPKWAAGTANATDIATFARLTRTFADAGARAGATLLGLWRVDHLLIRGGARHFARVSPRRLPLGDHFPLVLDVDLDPDVASPI